MCLCAKDGVKANCISYKMESFVLDGSQRGSLCNTSDYGVPQNFTSAIANCVLQSSHSEANKRMDPDGFNYVHNFVNSENIYEDSVVRP